WQGRAPLEKVLAQNLFQLQLPKTQGLRPQLLRLASGVRGKQRDSFRSEGRAARNPKPPRNSPRGGAGESRVGVNRSPKWVEKRITPKSRAESDARQRISFIYSHARHASPISGRVPPWRTTIPSSSWSSRRTAAS